MAKDRTRIREPKGETGSFGEMREPEFPQLTKARDYDRQRHIERALEMGMTREEAERHAEHDLRDRHDEAP